MRLTHELISAAFKYTYTSQQLAILGLVSPSAGWKRRLIGREISEHDYQCLLKANKCYSNSVQNRRMRLPDKNQSELFS